MKDMCTPMFIAALFIIARTWKNRLVPNRKRSTLRLYIVTLLIELIFRVHHEKLQAG